MRFVKRSGLLAAGITLLGILAVQGCGWVGLLDQGSSIDTTDDDWPSLNEFVAVEKFPEMTFQKEPVYPEEAREAGLEGLVWIKALVDEEGKVIDAIVAKSSGVESFDNAALDAAYEYEFIPGIQNGIPVKVWVIFKVKFKLDS